MFHMLPELEVFFLEFLTDVIDTGDTEGIFVFMDGY